MSRSGYNDDYADECGNWALICWRGAVESAIRGRRGQGLLKEMLAALDALPEKKLITNDLERDGCVCALGAVGKARGLDMADLDPEDSATVAGKFNIAGALAAEIVWVNDEVGPWKETDEARFERVRKWVVFQIKAEGVDDATR